MPVVGSGTADISYEVTGDGDPLLMIMGFAADSRMWMLQMPALSARYRCITFDNRGAGSSSLPDGECSMADMANDAIAVLDAAGVERAHVLGISMGGAIAQHLALKAPERVRSMVLAASWCSKNPYTQRVAELGKRIFDQLGREAIVKAFMLWIFTPEFLIHEPAMAGQIEALMLDVLAPAQTYEAQLAGLLEHDIRDQLGSVTAPTRVMVGRRDILVPPELSQEVARAIPGSELVMLETGHAFNVEEMDAFNAAVLEFLGRH